MLKACSSLPGDNILQGLVEPELVLRDCPDDVDRVLLGDVIDLSNAGIIL